MLRPWLKKWFSKIKPIRNKPKCIKQGRWNYGNSRPAVYWDSPSAGLEADQATPDAAGRAAAIVYTLHEIEHHVLRHAERVVTRYSYIMLCNLWLRTGVPSLNSKSPCWVRPAEIGILVLSVCLFVLPGVSLFVLCPNNILGRTKLKILLSVCITYTYLESNQSWINLVYKCLLSISIDLTT